MKTNPFIRYGWKENVKETLEIYKVNAKVKI